MRLTIGLSAALHARHAARNPAGGELNRSKQAEKAVSRNRHARRARSLSQWAKMVLRLAMSPQEAMWLMRSRGQRVINRRVVET